MNRNTLILSSVVFFHLALLWAVQSGLMRRASEVIVPAEVIVEFIEPVTPKVMPPRSVPLQPVMVKQALALTPPTQIKAEEPLLTAIADFTPSSTALVGVIAPAVVVAPKEAAPAVTAPPAPARFELPSSNADYLQNLRPAYPGQSERLGEQGQVLVRVFI